MRIYINNLNLDILPEIMKIYQEYYIKSETYIQIYSSDGIYKVDNSNITQLVCTDIDIKKFTNYYNNFTLIVDPSYFTPKIVNQLRPNHISTSLKRHIFKINNNSNLQLVIECEIKEEQNYFKTTLENVIIPTDMYFELLDHTDINDTLVKTEIIVFLSLLN
jgi:hypothetical protein